MQIVHSVMPYSVIIYITDYFIISNYGIIHLYDVTGK